MKDPRQAAARCLAEVVAGGASLTRQLPLDEQLLDPAQRPLYRELCYGTLRQYWRLDAALAPLFKKPLKTRDTDVRMLVYLGAYQLFHMRVAPHAVLNTTVEAARGLGKPWAAGLINALLRRCQREGQQLFAALDAPANHGQPAWLYRKLQAAWPAQLEQICEANLSYPPMCLRVNSRQGSREDYLAKLAAAEIDGRACEYADMGIRLGQSCPVDKLPGFNEGAVSVQDEAAQLCTQLLDLQPGQRVLDACAAPGGKSGAILEAQAGLAELVALDVDESRLQRVQGNLERLSLSATLVAADATQREQWWDGASFDRILLDAPCSGSGVLRRNPDISVHRRPQDIAALLRLQQALLDSLWAALKPEGILVYATCSVLTEENSDGIAAFLSRHEDAALLEIDATWGQPQPCGRQILPTVTGADGFFYARLRRRGA